MVNHILVCRGFMVNIHKQYWEREGLDERRHPSHIVIKEYVIPKINEIKKIIPIEKHTKLLDVGCGNGFFSYYFEKMCDTTGIDYSEKMIQLNPITQKYVMDAKDLKFKNDSFDIVFCNAFLHHVDNVNAVVKEMKRVSRKHVIILEPNRNNPLMFLFSLIVKEERKALKFSLAYLERLAKANGLRLISSFSYGLIAPNKTPKILLPLLKLLNFKFFLGMTNFILCEE
ncbi:MAG: class I SAM-dependent methyltransferase [Planctomycetota bacterium]